MHLEKAAERCIRQKRSSDTSNRRVVSNYSVYHTRAAEKSEPLYLPLPYRANSGSARHLLPPIAPPYCTLSGKRSAMLLISLSSASSARRVQCIPVTHRRTQG